MQGMLAGLAPAEAIGQGGVQVAARDATAGDMVAQGWDDLQQQLFG